ncbi:peptidylprolyl isomerase [Marinosulfonomonas sp. PRT-SC04]|nr:peptidylprolyl isomerase [Marinosulfonomonas sp. PRT-SC04]
MLKRIALPSFLGVLGVAIWAAFFFYDGADQQALASDTPSQNLVIEVGGSHSGTIIIDLLPNVAPKHVARIIELAKSGAYDGVVFHRVIDAFMAQTGDVQYGVHGEDNSRAGSGSSDLPDLKAEFSNIPFVLGTVGMARSASPDSANSQFFIMFGPAKSLNGEYTVVGRVTEGLETLYNIKLGDKSANGAVDNPDYMVKVTVTDE